MRVQSPGSGGLLSGKAGPYQASRTLISLSFIFHPLICRKHAFGDMDLVLAEAGRTRSGPVSLSRDIGPTTRLDRDALNCGPQLLRVRKLVRGWFSVRSMFTSTDQLQLTGPVVSALSATIRWGMMGRIDGMGYIVHRWGRFRRLPNSGRSLNLTQIVLTPC